MLTKKRIAVLIALIAAASFWGGVRPKRYSGEQEPLFAENAYYFAPTYYFAFAINSSAFSTIL